MAEVLAACVILSLLWGALGQHPSTPRSLQIATQRLRRRAQRNLRRRLAWLRAARALGMRVADHRGRWVIVSRSGEARLCAFPQGDELVVRVQHPGIPAQLAFETHPGPLADHTRVHVPGLPLHICVRAADESVALASFGEPARTALGQLPGHTVLLDRQIELVVSLDLGSEAGQSALEAVLDLAHALAFDPAHRAARLAHHTLSDGDSEMRLVAFGALWSRFGHRPEARETAQRALVHPDAGLRLLAADKPRHDSWWRSRLFCARSVMDWCGAPSWIENPRRPHALDLGWACAVCLLFLSLSSFSRPCGPSTCL